MPLRNIQNHAIHVLLLFLSCVVLAGCGSDTKEADNDTTDTMPSDADEDSQTDQTDGDDTDTDADVTDECGGCPGVTQCVEGECIYDPALADVCDPACREDTEMCVAGECELIGTRDCYDDSHCTWGDRSGGNFSLLEPVPRSETCVDADPEGGVPGTCTLIPGDPLVCPGGDGCDTVGSAGAIFAGASARIITTACGDCGVGFELPNPDFVQDGNAKWEGSLVDPTTFFDCGRDQLCPEDPGYPGPDEGEGDGIFQGLWIPGFSNSRAAQGVADPLWARIVIIEQDNVKVGIVALDFIGWFSSDIQRVEEMIPANLELDHVIYHATHNHESADVMGQWGPGDFDGDLPAQTGRDPAHLEYIYTEIVAGLEEANNNLVEVEVHVGKTNTGAELMVDSRDPIIINDDLVVVQLTEVADPDTTVATLINWHSHVESLWDDNPLVSSDYPHYLREAIENGLPAATDNSVMPPVDYPSREGVGGVAIFIAGSVGGLIGPGRLNVRDRDGTLYTERGDFERTRAYGEKVAEHAFQALETKETLTDPDLAFATKPMLIRVENRQFHTAMFGLKLFDRPFYNFEGVQPVSEENMPYGLSRMTILRLGDISFYTVPGELFPESAIGGYDGSKAFGNPIIENPDAPFPPDLDQAPEGPYMNDRVPGDYDFIIGLGEDTLGYHTPPYNFVLDEDAPYFAEAEGDHYEETNGVGPDVEPQINQVLDELLDLLP